MKSDLISKRHGCTSFLNYLDNSKKIFISQQIYLDKHKSSCIIKLS
nr:MAG TPA: hypothetical protein [Caudoviricetes sp.]